MERSGSTGHVVEYHMNSFPPAQGASQGVSQGKTQGTSNHLPASNYNHGGPGSHVPASNHHVASPPPFYTNLPRAVSHSSLADYTLKHDAQRRPSEHVSPLHVPHVSLRRSFDTHEPVQSTLHPTHSRNMESQVSELQVSESRNSESRNLESRNSDSTSALQKENPFSRRHSVTVTVAESHIDLLEPVLLKETFKTTGIEAVTGSSDAQVWSTTVTCTQSAVTVSLANGHVLKYPSSSYSWTLLPQKLNNASLAKSKLKHALVVIPIPVDRSISAEKSEKSEKSIYDKSRNRKSFDSMLTKRLSTSSMVSINSSATSITTYEDLAPAKSRDRRTSSLKRFTNMLRRSNTLTSVSGGAPGAAAVAGAAGEYAPAESRPEYAPVVLLFDSKSKVEMWRDRLSGLLESDNDDIASSASSVVTTKSRSKFSQSFTSLTSLAQVFHRPHTPPQDSELKFVSLSSGDFDLHRKTSLGHVPSQSSRDSQETVKLDRQQLKTYKEANGWSRLERWNERRLEASEMSPRVIQTVNREFPVARSAVTPGDVGDVQEPAFAVSQTRVTQTRVRHDVRHDVRHEMRPSTSPGFAKPPAASLQHELDSLNSLDTFHALDSMDSLNAFGSLDDYDRLSIISEKSPINDSFPSSAHLDSIASFMSSSGDEWTRLSMCTLNTSNSSCPITPVAPLTPDSHVTPPMLTAFCANATPPMSANSTPPLARLSPRKVKPMSSSASASSASSLAADFWLPGHSKAKSDIRSALARDRDAITVRRLHKTVSNPTLRPSTIAQADSMVEEQRMTRISGEAAKLWLKRSRGNVGGVSPFVSLQQLVREPLVREMTDTVYNGELPPWHALSGASSRVPKIPVPGGVRRAKPALNRAASVEL